MSYFYFRPGVALQPGSNNVYPEDLSAAMKQIRRSNLTLISRSLRTSYSCFDDLDMQNFEPTSDYLVNFISNGINRCSSTPLRPVSILWPDNFDQFVEQLSVLDAYLINSGFREKSVDWMIKEKLTIVPDCQHCKDKMKINYSNNLVTWQCENSQHCIKYSMPILRPTIFSGFEHVGIDKLLFSLYYWSTCTPAEELYNRMNIDPVVLTALWKKLQNVCRITLEKTYPRHRLTNVVNDNLNEVAETEPIDLVSIKLNNLFVVCAKHPKSNLVRLGFHIPKLSKYSFADLTESWFAHGAHIRVSESKFLKLQEKRTDLRVELVTRIEMISKDDRFNRNSAFGYMVSQLTHVLKDCDSSSLTCEHLKLILAEMQWREFYGTTPFDSFTNIVKHISLYGDVSDWYTEPSIVADLEQALVNMNDEVSSTYNDYIWAEEYFYATIEPKHSNTDKPLLYRLPRPDVRICCHLCNNMFETFEISLHIIVHVEENRKKHNTPKPKKQVECKHCFKSFNSDELAIHSSIFRSHYHHIRHGCRICCIKFDDRNSYLRHMRRRHFEHESPYRCPCCSYASSFQRDIFIHFQEEHRYSLNVLCPLCLKRFTVSQPETITRDKMLELSRAVYNHLAEHYLLSRDFTCSDCNLCFLNKRRLLKHRRNHHNPLEIFKKDEVSIVPFSVDKECQDYCVKALPMELFIANKRPNFQPTSNDSVPDSQQNSAQVDAPDPNLNPNPTQPKPTATAAPQDIQTEKQVPDSTNNDVELSDHDEPGKSLDENTILVRGLDEANQFLAGGLPVLSVSKVPLSFTTITRRNAKTGETRNYNIVRSSTHRRDELSSQKLIEYLSKLNRADGIVANQSVILTPTGLAAKCVECQKMITTDHYVAGIACKKCDYYTFCPRAATNHKSQNHPDVSQKS